MGKKSFGAAALAAVLAGGVLAGCSSKDTKSVTSDSGQSSQGGKVELTFWHGLESPENNQVLTEMINKFNASHDKIKVTAQSYGAQDQAIGKIQTAVAGKKAPDLVWLAPAYTGQFAKAGVLASVEDLMKEDKNFKKEDVYPGLWDVSSYNGKVYTAPFDAGNLGIFYNKDLFEKAGIKEPPKTWDEFRDAAKKLTVDSNNDGKPEQYGFMVPMGTQEWTVWTWQTYLWQAGGQFLDKDQKKPMFNSPEGVKALQLWLDLVNKDKVAYFSETDAGYKTGDFENGKVAMQIVGPWILPQLDKTKKVKYGTFFLPKDKDSATNLGGENLFIFKSNPEKEKAAWEFAKFIMSNDFQVDWAIKTGYLPVNKTALNDSKFKDYLAKNPNYKTFVDQMDYGKARPSIPAYNAISAALGKELEQALYGKKQPDAALNDAAKAAEKELGKN